MNEHVVVLRSLGLNNLVVGVNKMDKNKFQSGAFQSVQNDMTAFFKQVKQHRNSCVLLRHIHLTSAFFRFSITGWTEACFNFFRSSLRAYW
mmetsp:Transcript_19104/g.50677  ORF Transcript_19104/g.50677 Transcript_19104/m.50677 type:complete len:91 (+) Transcript_19104:90-362(+)